MARLALSLQNVAKVWSPEGRPEVEALRDFSLDIAEGEFVVFLGPSGCGKSTLLYMIAGLEEVSGGAIMQDGLAVDGPSAPPGARR